MISDLLGSIIETFEVLKWYPNLYLFFLISLKLNSVGPT